MQIGVSNVVITPETGVDLAGFGRPNRKVVGTHDDLYLSSMVLKQGDKKVLIISADVLGFGLKLTPELKSEIYNKFGFTEDEILLGASHTHSGPQITDNTLAIGEVDENYIKFFRNKVISSVEAALNSMEEADAYYGKSRCNIGVNRRLIIDGKCDFAPNENGPIDKDVIVLKFMKGDEVKAILYNYTCHPSTVNTDYASADFPGKARKVIQDALGSDVPVLFLQGCCGNIRTRTIKDGRFRAGTWEDVEEFGDSLGKSVLEACNSKMEKLDVNITTKIMTIDLPIREIPKREELEDIKSNGSAHQKMWAEKMLSEYEDLKTAYPFTIQRISLGNDFSIVAMGGEVCVEYALYVKNISKSKMTMTAGYANAVTAYIPTDEMFDQGGYEPIGSTIYYSLPAPFKTGIEKMVLKSLDEVVSD